MNIIGKLIIVFSLISSLFCSLAIEISTGSRIFVHLHHRLLSSYAKNSNDYFSSLEMTSSAIPLPSPASLSTHKITYIFASSSATAISSVLFLQISEAEEPLLTSCILLPFQVPWTGDQGDQRRDVFWGIYFSI